jgi:hypothetical protein
MKILLENFIKNKFVHIALFHILICIIVALIHNLTIRQIIFFNTGGISLACFYAIIIFIIQLPISLFLLLMLFLCHHLTMNYFIEITMIVNSAITFIMLLCLLLRIDFLFIDISIGMGFLTFVFCTLYLFVNRKYLSNKRLSVFYRCYSMFIAMMLIVPYSMKVLGISWLYFFD